MIKPRNDKHSGVASVDNREVLEIQERDMPKFAHVIDQTHQWDAFVFYWEFYCHLQTLSTDTPPDIVVKIKGRLIQIINKLNSVRTKQVMERDGKHVNTRVEVLSKQINVLDMKLDDVYRNILTAGSNSEEEDSDELPIDHRGSQQEVSYKTPNNGPRIQSAVPSTPPPKETSTDRFNRQETEPQRDKKRIKIDKCDMNRLRELKQTQGVRRAAVEQKKRLLKEKNKAGSMSNGEYDTTIREINHHSFTFNKESERFDKIAEELHVALIKRGLHLVEAATRKVEIRRLKLSINNDILETEKMVRNAYDSMNKNPSEFHDDENVRKHMALRKKVKEYATKQLLPNLETPFMSKEVKEELRGIFPEEALKLTEWELYEEEPRRQNLNRWDLTTTEKYTVRAFLNSSSDQFKQSQDECDELLENLDASTKALEKIADAEVLGMLTVHRLSGGRIPATYFTDKYDKRFEYTIETKQGPVQLIDMSYEGFNVGRGETSSEFRPRYVRLNIPISGVNKVKHFDLEIHHLDQPCTGNVTVKVKKAVPRSQTSKMMTLMDLERREETMKEEDMKSAQRAARHLPAYRTDYPSDDPKSHYWTNQIAKAAKLKDPTLDIKDAIQIETCCKRAIRELDGLFHAFFRHEKGQHVTPNCFDQSKIYTLYKITVGRKKMNSNIKIKGLNDDSNKEYVELNIKPRYKCDTPNCKYQATGYYTGVPDQLLCTSCTSKVDQETLPVPLEKVHDAFRDSRKWPDTLAERRVDENGNIVDPKRQDDEDDSDDDSEDVVFV